MCTTAEGIGLRWDLGLTKMPSGGSVMNWPPSLIRHGVHFLQLLRVIVLDRLPLELERRSHEPRFGRPEFLRENKENISCLCYQFALIHLLKN